MRTQQETDSYFQGQIDVLLMILSEQAVLLGDRNLADLQQKVRDITMPESEQHKPRHDGMRRTREIFLHLSNDLMGKASRADPHSPHTSLLGYFDGRQLAAETIMGMLIRHLTPEDNRHVHRALQRIKEVLADTQAPEFMRGFTDCLKRLESSRHGA